VESGSREENALNQQTGVFHRFHETVKDQADTPESRPAVLPHTEI
jgi:hypothetical protein